MDYVTSLHSVCFSPSLGPDEESTTEEIRRQFESTSPRYLRVSNSSNGDSDEENDYAFARSLSASTGTHEAESPPRTSNSPPESGDLMSASWFRPELLNAGEEGSQGMAPSPRENSPPRDSDREVNMLNELRGQTHSPEYFIRSQRGDMRLDPYPPRDESGPSNIPSFRVKRDSQSPRSHARRRSKSGEMREALKKMLRVMEVIQRRSQSMEDRVDIILDALRGIGERVRRVEETQNPTNTQVRRSEREDDPPDQRRRVNPYWDSPEMMNSHI